MDNSLNRNIENLVITGAFGALGWKFFQHLARFGKVNNVVGLDINGMDKNKEDHIKQLIQKNPNLKNNNYFDIIECDLRDWNDSRWRNVVNDSDTIIHFAVQNVWPDAPWIDVMASFQMTINIAYATMHSKNVSRFVFSSSSHAMGRYKDPPFSDGIGSYGLTTDLEPAPGTVWFDGKKRIDSYKYGSSKVASETLCRSLAIIGKGGKTFLCIRIGWCQHGKNTPDRISITWDQNRQKQFDSPEEWSSDLRWFKEMWLSDDDFTCLFERAIYADGSNWKDGFLITNGESNNLDMKWSLKEARKGLGYEPKDDVYSYYKP